MFSYGKYDHKVRYCPTIASRGKRLSKLLQVARMLVNQRGISSIASKLIRKRTQMKVPVSYSFPFVSLLIGLMGFF